MTSSPTSLWHNPFPSIICSTTNSGSSCYNLSQIVSLISLKPSTNLWGFSSIPSHNSSTSPALIFPGCTLSSGYFFPLLEITSNNSNLLFLLLKIFFLTMIMQHMFTVFRSLLSCYCLSDVSLTTLSEIVLHSLFKTLVSIFSSLFIFMSLMTL